MKKLLILSTLSLWLFVNTGCYKDIDNTPEPVVIVERPDVKINTTLHGVVSDFDGNISDNYTIQVNDQSFAINQDIYYLDLNLANKRNQHISIEKEGKEIAFANISLIENEINKIDITAFPEWNTTTISESSNNISLDNALALSFVTANNNTEQIEYGLIDDRKLIHQLGLWGTDGNENEYFLNTVSAFYLNSDSTNFDTSNLSLDFNLSNNIATEDLAIFHLNESFHQWILVEEINEFNGSIQLPELGYYLLANISKSTFVEGKLSYEQLPLSFQNFKLSVLDGESLELRSSEDGRWSSFMPSESISQLSINDPCDMLVYQEELTIEENVSFDSQLTIEDSEDIIPINFTGLTCDGGITSTPGSKINFGPSEEVMIFSSKIVHFALLSCDEITISGYDVFENQTGISIPWDNGIEDNLEFLSSCEEFTNGYSYFRINREEELFPAFKLSTEGNKTILSSEENDIRLIIKGEGEGSYENNQVNFFIDKEDFGDHGYRMMCENSTVGCGFHDCYVSHFEDMGNGLTRISFAGTLWMQTIENPTAGNYKLEGQIVTKL